MAQAVGDRASELLGQGKGLAPSALNRSVPPVPFRVICTPDFSIVVEPLCERLMQRFGKVVDLESGTVDNKPDNFVPDVGVLGPVVRVRRNEQHLTDDPAHGGRAHADLLPNQRDRMAQVFRLVLMNGDLRTRSAAAMPVRKSICNSACFLRYRHSPQMRFYRLGRIRGQRQVPLLCLPVLVEARDGFARGSQNQLLGKAGFRGQVRQLVLRELGKLLGAAKCECCLVVLDTGNRDIVDSKRAFHFERTIARPKRARTLQ